MTQPTEAAGLPEMENLCQFCGEPADHSCNGSHTCMSCCCLWGLSLHEDRGEMVHKWIGEVGKHGAKLSAQLKTLTAERDEARAAINIPETEDFFKGRIIPLGTAHRMIRELTASLDEARKQSGELREAALDFLVETDERNLTALASEAFRKLKRIVVAPTPTGGKRNE